MARYRSEKKDLLLGTNDSGSLLIIIDNGEHEKTRTEAKKGFSLSYGVLGKRNLSWAFAISVLFRFSCHSNHLTPYEKRYLPQMLIVLGLCCLTVAGVREFKFRSPRLGG